MSSPCGGSPQARCFVIWIDVNQFPRLCLASRFLSVERAWSFQPASWQFARSQLHHGIRPSRSDTAMRSDSLPPPKTLLRRPSPTICPGEVLSSSQANVRFAGPHGGFTAEAARGTRWRRRCGTFVGRSYSLSTMIYSIGFTFNECFRV